MIQIFTATFQHPFKTCTRQQSNDVQYYTQANVDICYRNIGDDQTLQLKKNSVSPLKNNP